MSDEDVLAEACQRAADFTDGEKAFKRYIGALDSLRSQNQALQEENESLGLFVKEAHEETLALQEELRKYQPGQGEGWPDDRHEFAGRLTALREAAEALQERSEKAEALLRDAVDLVDTQTISEQGWHDDVIDYFRALSPTQEICPTCGTTDRSQRYVTRPDLHGPTHCANPWHNWLVQYQPQTGW